MVRARTASCGSMVAILSTLSACGSDPAAWSAPAPSGSDPLLDPPPAGAVQVRAIGTSVPAGADLEWCEVAEFPGTSGQAYYVNRIDLAKSAFSHHLFVNTVAPGSAADRAATELGIGNRVPCVTASQSFGEGTVLVAGAAKPRQTIPYPDGIAQRYIGGQKLILDYHYFNTSTEQVDAAVAVNFHLVPESGIRKLAHGFSAMNLTIQIPPLGKAAFTAECRFSQELLVGGIVRHTHRWGTDYTVWRVDRAGAASELWTSDDWQEKIEKRFSEPLLFHAGEGFRYRCEFENTEDRTLRFGTKATDEMCNLFGAWWVVNEGDAETPQECLILSIDADGIGRASAGVGGPL